jgi:type I restriction enzyme M protein
VPRARRTEPTTPQAKLNAAIKSARDIMRKDAGLNGDLDRIPQLAWLLFLRAFDALEQRRELTERDYRPAIEEPYRWRDWAADPVSGRTGTELLEFVDGNLLPYLRELIGSGQHDPRDTLAAVFKETYNRMLSGYLLRDVVNKVNEVNFNSSDDIHTMAHLYESMLREVRDAAGDSGEFYTPRPVIRFVVQQVDPRLGEIVLDPACGTGGFLVEAYEHIAPSVKTVEQRRELQADLRGIEKKPLPYLLGMMNLSLHGIEQPAIVRDNALAHPVTQIRAADRVDVVLTNPPFGGEEEKAVQTNFPDATRTAETALLFLQVIERVLRSGGRCGMIVPNSLLFGDGVAARVKERLLSECNLHTIVRLPPGAFAPYTDIPTNLLFFEKTGRTRDVWFYELPPPERRKKYSKTRPIRSEEFAACRAWWGGSARESRVETEWAWQVPIGEIEARGYNLDLKNPRQEDLTHRPPTELVTELVQAEHEMLGALEEIGGELEVFAGNGNRARGWVATRLEDVLRLDFDEVQVEPNRTYPNVGVFSFGRGLFEKPPIDGAATSASRLYRIRSGQLIYSRLFAFEGAYAAVEPRFDGFFVSNEFPTFTLDETRIDIGFLAAYLRSPAVWEELARGSKGLGLRRQRVHPETLLAHTISLPTLREQREIRLLLEKIDAVAAQHERAASRIGALGVSALNSAFNG